MRTNYSWISAMGDLRSMMRPLVWALSATLAISAADAGFAQDDISTLVQQARDGFQPVTAEQVASVRTELNQRMAALERFVNPRSANGQEWLTYLKWDALKQAIADPAAPKLDALDATLDRLNRDQNGLELPRFRAVADTLRRYRDLAAVSQWEQPAELYGQQLGALSDSIDRLREQPTPANEVALSNQLAIVSAIGQAPELLAAVRKEFGRPNVFFDVSSVLLKAAAEPIDRTERITDNILGTSIHGDAQTTGAVEISTVPSDKAGVLDLTSSGRSTTKNVGYNGPAVIRSTGHTDFVATKRVELTDRAFSSLPAWANATTDTDIHSISKRGGGMGSRMVSKIGWQRARQSERQAESIASDHAEDRIKRRFNNEVNEKLGDARKRYEDEYRRPLARRGEVPNDIRFSSSKDALSLRVTQAGRSQLAASTEPPAAPEGHDMTMRVHQSAVNNYSGVTLGGATASQSEPGQETKFDVTMPKFLKDAWEKRQTDSPAETAAATEPFKPWSLKFRPGRPISVDFADGKVKLTLHVARLESGSSDPFTNWDVWGVFVPEPKDGGIILRREGELDALPTNFRGNLGSVQAAQRNNLIKEFNSRSEQGEGFPNTIEFPKFEPEGALASAGPLELKELVSDGGWLTLIWDRAGAGEETKQARR